MFGIFPSQWSQPRPRRLTPCRSLADHHFHVQHPKPPTPIPEPAKNFMPLCELCLNEPIIDTTEIDKLLDEIYNPAPDSKKRKIFKMVDTINHKLAENINSLQGNTTVNGDNVSKEDLLELLQAFLNYSKTIEIYLKTINQETIPSSH